MSLADQLDAESRTASSRRGLVEELLATLPKDDAAAFRRALEDRERVTAPALAKIMTKAGHPIGDGAIRRWRDANCDI